MTKKINKVSDLKNGQATVIESGKEKIAVYKDMKGKIHSVSAVCTHMGCIVLWNNAELTWDCPCHGSRFSFEGKVIQSPANTDLPVKPIPHKNHECENCECKS